MKNQIERKRLYKEAFAILEQTKALLLKARTSHERAMAEKLNTKRAA